MTDSARGQWRRWVVTLGGSGMSPVAPGTAGSFAITALLGLAFYVLHQQPGGITPTVWNALLLGGVLFFGGLCVALGSWTVQHFGRKDPGPCVLDEAAGICLTGLFVPMYTGRREWIALAAIFLAFRLFDIVKLPPAKQLERLPHGWGILMDDLAAAVYANIVCQVLLRSVIH